MEKNIIELFAERVVVELKKALAERKKQDGTQRSAMVTFNVVEVLKSLGATYALAGVATNKDYTWLRINASKDGFYYPIDFGQRRQATRAELDTISGGDIAVKDAACIAGIYEDEEGGTHYSMKWDTLFLADGDAFAFSGPVRKFHSETGTYDGPVVSE